MKTFRLYYDKDAEEKWLKEMSLKGWALKKYCLGCYTFESCKPGEYHYQIDLLDEDKMSQEDYKAFMEEAGVQVVAR